MPEDIDLKPLIESSIFRTRERLWIYDVIAFVPISIMVGIFVWQRYQIDKGVMTESTPMPTLREIVLCNMLPFGLSILWIGYRYVYVAMRNPFMRTPRFRKFIILGVPALIFLMIYCFGRFLQWIAH